jgi:hypothetical protein
MKSNSTALHAALLLAALHAALPVEAKAANLHWPSCTSMTT